MKKPKLEFLVLSREDMIKSGATDWKIALETTEEALKLHSTGEDVLPYKTVLRWGDLSSEQVRGHINAMPAYVGGDFDVIGIKWVGAFPESAKRGQSMITGLQILNDAHTGWPLAIMDGALITSMRTAAVMGVAIKYLASKYSKVAAIIGTGVEGRSHTAILKEVLPNLKEIKGFDIRKESCVSWADEMRQKLNFNTIVTDSIKDAVKNADIILNCAGYPRGSVPAEAEAIKSQWIEKGAFVGVTAGPPLEPAIIERCSKIVVDDWQQIKHRFDQHGVPGCQFRNWYIRDGQIYGQIGEIISGKLAGRMLEDDIIVLLTVGMGTEDATLAYRIYKNAVVKGLGTKVTVY